jgi:ribosomal protein L7Ae-like RNA K-turn-binding protein
VQDEVEVSGEAPKGQMSVLDALKGVLKLALMHDGLARGLREASKALDRRQAHMCVLNEACEEEAYKKLVVALCSEHKIPLIKVPDGKQLGEWAGLCAYTQLFYFWLCSRIILIGSQAFWIVREMPARLSTARALSSRIGVRSRRSAPSSSTTSRLSSRGLLLDQRCMA